MKRLYQYDVDIYYASLKGMFVADEQEVTNAIGRRIYWGEIAGKHSEIVIDVEVGDFSVINVPEDFVLEFETKIGSFGYNPIERLRDEE